MNTREIENIKKKSMLYLDVNSNTKNNVIHSELMILTKNILQKSTKKNLIVIVLENSNN